MKFLLMLELQREPELDDNGELGFSLAVTTSLDGSDQDIRAALDVVKAAPLNAELQTFLDQFPVLLPWTWTKVQVCVDRDITGAAVWTQVQPLTRPSPSGNLVTKVRETLFDQAMNRSGRFSGPPDQWKRPGLPNGEGEFEYAISNPGLPNRPELNWPALMATANAYPARVGLEALGSVWLFRVSATTVPAIGIRAGLSFTDAGGTFWTLPPPDQISADGDLALVRSSGEHEVTLRIGGPTTNGNGASAWIGNDTLSVKAINGLREAPRKFAGAFDVAANIILAHSGPEAAPITTDEVRLFFVKLAEMLHPGVACRLKSAGASPISRELLHTPDGAHLYELILDRANVGMTDQSDIKLREDLKNALLGTYSPLWEPPPARVETFAIPLTSDKNVGLRFAVARLRAMSDTIAALVPEVPADSEKFLRHFSAQPVAECVKTLNTVRLAAIGQQTLSSYLLNSWGAVLATPPLSELLDPKRREAILDVIRNLDAPESKSNLAERYLLENLAETDAHDLVQLSVKAGAWRDDEPTALTQFLTEQMALRQPRIPLSAVLEGLAKEVARQLYDMPANGIRDWLAEPHPLEIHVAQAVLDKNDRETGRLAGYGLLLKRTEPAASGWCCLTWGNVVARRFNETLPVWNGNGGVNGKVDELLKLKEDDGSLIEAVVPAKPSHTHGILDVAISYDGTPRIVDNAIGVRRSPEHSTALSGPPPVLHGAPAYDSTSDWAKLPQLVFGGKYEVLAFKISNAGVLPRQLALDRTADPTQTTLRRHSEFDANAAGMPLAKKFEYRRRRGVGAMVFNWTDGSGKTPPSYPEGTSLISSFLSAVPKTRRQEPTLLLLAGIDDAAAGQRYSQATLSLQRPSCTVKTAVYWLRHCELSTAGDTKAKWTAAINLLETIEESDGYDPESLPLADPAVTHVLVRYRRIWSAGVPTPGEWTWYTFNLRRVDESAVPPAVSWNSSDPKDLKGQLVTLRDRHFRLDKITIAVNAVATGQAAPPSNSELRLALQLEPGVWEIEAYPAYRQRKVNDRWPFEDDLGFVDVNPAPPGGPYALFEPYLRRVEVGCADFVDAQGLFDRVVASSEEGSGEIALHLMPRSVAAEFNISEIRYGWQAWRWQGRPVSPYPRSRAVQESDRIPNIASTAVPDENSVRALVSSYPVAWDFDGFSDRAASPAKVQSKLIDLSREAIELDRVVLEDDSREMVYRAQVWARHRYGGAYAAAFAEAKAPGKAPKSEVQAEQTREEAYKAVDAAGRRWRRVRRRGDWPRNSARNKWIRSQGKPHDKGLPPAVAPEEVPTPLIKFVIPLTTGDLDAGARTASLLAVLDEEWGQCGGLAETLEAEIVAIRRDAQKADGKDPPFELLEARQEAGDDPIRSGRGSESYLHPLRTIGPIGHTFDTGADAALFVSASFLVSPPPMADPWWMAKLRFRRVLLPEGMAGYAGVSKSFRVDATDSAACGQVHVTLDKLGAAANAASASVALRLSCDAKPVATLTLRQEGSRGEWMLELEIPERAMQLVLWDRDKGHQVGTSMTYKSRVDAGLGWSDASGTAEPVPPAIRIAFCRMSPLVDPNDPSRLIGSRWEASVRVRDAHGWRHLGTLWLDRKPADGAEPMGLPLSGEVVEASIQADVVVAETSMRYSAFTQGQWCQFLPNQEFRLADILGDKRDVVLKRGKDDDSIEIKGASLLKFKAEADPQDGVPEFDVLLVTQVVHSADGIRDSEDYVGLFDRSVGEMKLQRTRDYNDGGRPVPASAMLRGRFLRIERPPRYLRRDPKRAPKPYYWDRLFPRVTEKDGTAIDADAELRLIGMTPPFGESLD